jgi:hypothetical protein
MDLRCHRARRSGNPSLRLSQDSGGSGARIARRGEDAIYPLTDHLGRGVLTALRITGIVHASDEALTEADLVR